jgi:hypothetical protein
MLKMFLHSRHSFNSSLLCLSVIYSSSENKATRGEWNGLDGLIPDVYCRLDSPGNCESFPASRGHIDTVATACILQSPIHNSHSPVQVSYAWNVGPPQISCHYSSQIHHIALASYHSTLIFPEINLLFCSEMNNTDAHPCLISKSLFKSR